MKFENIKSIIDENKMVVIVNFDGKHDKVYYNGICSGVPTELLSYNVDNIGYVKRFPNRLYIMIDKDDEDDEE